MEVGWKIILSSDDKEQTLPKLTDGDILKFIDAKILDKVTKPPSHFTPSTLLQAMKEIFKFVRDDSLKQKLKDCSGIGTEATRAGIIEKLQTQNFLKLDKKFLEPTEKAKQAVKILPTELTFPDLTAVWENIMEREPKKISFNYCTNDASFERNRPLKYENNKPVKFKVYP